MARAISLRDDFDAAALRQLAKNSKNGPQIRRLLSLAAIYDGATRTEARRSAGRFRLSATGYCGSTREALTACWMARRQAALQTQRCTTPGGRRHDERGPIPAIHGVVRWRKSLLTNPPAMKVEVAIRDQAQSL